MSKITVEFTKDELQQLLNDDNSCVSVKRDVYNLALYPYHLSNVTNAVKSILNSRIARFEKKLGGILLGYRNIKLLSSEGTIVTDSCHIYVDVEADFYIFKPEVGSSLRGVVNKKSGDHVGCLVHRLFNIAVPKQSKNDNWIGYHVEIDQEVVVNVTYIDLGSRLPYIRAEFDEENIKQLETSKSHVYFNEYEEITETPVHKKKKSKSNINELIDSYEENEEHHSKKKKKRKSKDLNEDDEEVNKVHEKISKEKRKKEKRKSKELVEENEYESKKNGNHSSSEKHHKSEEKIKIKKRKHSLENLINEDEMIPKKKRINLHLTEDFTALEQENSSTPNKVNKELNDSKKHKKHKHDTDMKKFNGNISDLEKSFNESVSKKKNKNRESTDKIEKDKSKSRKRKHEEVSGEDTPVKKHKSKKKKHSLDAEKHEPELYT